MCDGYSLVFGTPIEIGLTLVYPEIWYGPQFLVFIVCSFPPSETVGCVWRLTCRATTEHPTSDFFWFSYNKDGSQNLGKYARFNFAEL